MLKYWPIQNDLLKDIIQGEYLPELVVEKWKKDNREKYGKN